MGETTDDQDAAERRIKGLAARLWFPATRAPLAIAVSVWSEDRDERGRWFAEAAVAGGIAERRVTDAPSATAADALATLEGSFRLDLEDRIARDRRALGATS